MILTTSHEYVDPLAPRRRLRLGVEFGVTAPNMALAWHSKCVEALRRLPSQRRLPLALLLLALATLFLFVLDHGYFYRLGHHDWISSKVLALTDNVSPQYGFTRFSHLEAGQDGNPKPTFLYNRFPAGGYVLLKLAMLPFEGDLSAKILAARMLMLACFAAAAVLAYLALARITGSRWAACGATALAFSSHYCLHYNDMITTEVAVDLFAVMLVFHGMTIFVQQDRLSQLLAKTCIALALGWHVYALLLPFIAFSLARDLISAHRGTPPENRVRCAFAATFLGRPFALGATALAFGVLVLSFNLIGEHALDKAASVADLPTWRTMMKRTGQEQWFSIMHAEVLSWPAFLESQFRILARMFLPYALPARIDALQLDDRSSAQAWMESLFFTFGVAALAVCLVWLSFNRQRILLATLALFGFVWSLPMRHSVAFHDFESVFYVGIPLVLFALALLHVRRLFGERPVALVAVAALLVFVFSNWQMNGANRDAAGSAFHAEVMSDFDTIRRQTEGAAIGVMLIGERTGPIGSHSWWNSRIQTEIGAPFALEYYLAQRVLAPLQHPTASESDMDGLDFVVANWQEPATLTPGNRRFHLYSRSALVADRDALLGSLLARGNFDLYKKGNTLIHIKSPCTEADVASPIALHLWPVDRADLPEHRRQYGFHNFDFHFDERGRRHLADETQTCTAWTKLPTYALAKVGTGQADENGTIWWIEAPLALPAK